MVFELFNIIASSLRNFSVFSETSYPVGFWEYFSVAVQVHLMFNTLLCTSAARRTSTPRKGTVLPFHSLSTYVISCHCNQCDTLPFVAQSKSKTIVQLLYHYQSIEKSPAASITVQCISSRYVLFLLLDLISHYNGTFQPLPVAPSHFISY